MVQIVAPDAEGDLTSSESANAKTVQLPQATSSARSPQPTESKSAPSKPAESKSTPSKPATAIKRAASSAPSPKPKAAAATAAADAESSEELFADAAALLSGESSAPPPSTSQPATSPSATSQASADKAAKPETAQPVAAGEADPAELPSTLPAKSKFATYRLIAMIGGGVVVGGLLLTLVVRQILIDDQPVAQIETPATSAEVAPETPVESPSAEPKPPQDETTEQPTPPTNPADKTPAPKEANPPAEKPAPETVAEKPPAEMPLDESQPQENPFLFDVPDSAKPKSEQPAPEEVAANDAAEPSDEQRMKFAQDPLTGVLGEAFPLFDESVFDAPDSQSLAETAQPEAPLPDPASIPSQEPVAKKPAPRAVNVAARLNDPFLNARFRDIPLLDHLRNLTRWSTIPISVDPLALQSADIVGDKKINVNQKGTNTERLLRGAVEPLRMSVDVQSDQIRIVPLKQAGMQRPTIRFQVDDLADDDQEVAELAYNITHLVEPTSWQGAGGGNTCRTGKKELQLAADSKTVFQALVLVEKLRVARGLDPRSRYDEKLFELAPRTEQGAAMLDKKVQLTFAEPAELLEITEQLEDTTGVILLIDWQSLLKEGWNPATEATMLALDVPLREALNTLLDPLEMDFRVIDDRTLEVAMKSDLATRPEVEFYPISDLADGPTRANALINRLKKELAIADDPQFALIYDAPSKNLMVRLPQAKQVELGTALANMRTP
ncbi:hypothetical protein Enr8_35650 [Blastopirellula retiformator]|uniref:Uncharacterized protein n=2 Tax=Blastopirellula retiformator TaxID=2527970 RepID=A0A5C5UZK7_9BACT|nr:hypothetical protein Enr8_35650 [Blastopirellula retiformator]